jgi:dTDP-4-dehydrorhamnose 3,5-epimerase
MKTIQTQIPGVLILEPTTFRDERGFFLESYSERTFATLGIRHRFVQDNHSKSSRGTIRGLHYQLQRPQAKLCRVIAGEVLDVAVDVRLGSPTFGQWVSALLSAENQHQIFIPEGFAHGFAVLSESAEFLYKCSDFYDPSTEYGIRWNDPDLAIPWTIGDPRVSAKDAAYPSLREVVRDHLPLYRIAI